MADALATPVVGLLSDCSGGVRALGLGRRKLWNLIGVAIVSVCFWFTFGQCIVCAVRADEGSGSPTSVLRTASFAVFAALFNVGWAAIQVSHMALVPELTHCNTERVALNSARYAFTVIASVYVYACMLLLRHVATPPPQPKLRAVQVAQPSNALAAVVQGRT